MRRVREQTGSLTVRVELSAPSGWSLAGGISDSDSDSEAKAAYNGSYTLSWSPVTGMASYTIERACAC